ncbi:archaeosortase C [Methanomethylovorans sp.]|uniref:archaeosortase C n=1 Tax=Methanomethylovorans sp. TaxID=2758717 RepID=UPI00345E08CE
MTNENKNIAIILLVLALFTGATIELSEGTPLVGVILFLIAAFLITRIDISKGQEHRRSIALILLGSFIVLADVVFNYGSQSSIGTLDSMTFFLGLSLIAAGMNSPQIKKMGQFGAYISGIFIVLFLVFYTLFGALNIDFLHIFDHYFVLLPTVAIMKLFGIPLEVVAIETVRMSGVEELTIIIGGPCSGLYSMFLLIGIVVGYGAVEKIPVNRILFLLGFAIAVAYIANLVRVMILYITAYFYGYDAMMTVHTHIGWMIFAAVAGAIMYIMDLQRRTVKDQ